MVAMNKHPCVDLGENVSVMSVTDLVYDYLCLGFEIF